MSRDLACEDCFDHIVSELRLASTLTTGLFANIIKHTCDRTSLLANAGKARIRQLIQVGAQVDAVLALIELKLPQLGLRRLIVDDGRWHCSLSRQPNLPIELDNTAEGQHEHVALAVLIAFVEALRMETAARESTVLARPTCPTADYAMCCDNFS